MPGIVFEDQVLAAPAAPNRMDIALFVGFVRRRAGAPLPAGLTQWLGERGWTSKPYARPIDDLLDVPAPIESWKQFDDLFDWGTRNDASADGSTYLGAAVRSFFAQGGRRCYVVRVGDPWPLITPRQNRLNQIAKLIPGFPARFLPSAADRLSWYGVGHLFGLPDVSFVCLPDLADAVAADRTRVEAPELPPGPPEQFVTCTPTAPAPPPDLSVRGVGAPGCDDTGLGYWASALNLVTSMLIQHAREAQLIAALPLVDDVTSFDAAPATSFLQLAYPWTRTPGSAALPGQLESPDGVLTGVLARNALLRGTFRSAANLHLADVHDVFPVIDRHEQQLNRLIERVSLIGPTPSGLRLLSDVTMFAQETYRPAAVSRLVATLVRTARRLGEEVTFESSGEKLWGSIRYRLDAFMRGLYHAGAFLGASAAEAYQVRCDRSTMSQNDSDSGRVIAYVQFAAAAPVDTITVMLILNESRQVAVIQGEAA